MISIKNIPVKILKTFYAKISDIFSKKDHTHTTVLKGTLLKGDTTLTFKSSSITEKSLLEVSADKYGLSVLYIERNHGSVAITFSEQTSNMNVKVVVY